MSINNITRTNTIDEWRIQTNQSAGELNKLETGNYTKTSGTLRAQGTSNVVIDSQGTSLQVTNTALFSTNVTIGKELSIGTQETATGNVGIGGIVSIYGPNTSLYVANNVVSNGSLVVKSNIVANNLTINSNTVIVGTANLGYLGVANSGVFGKNVSVGTTLSVTGNTTVGNLTTANMVYAGTLSVEGRTDISGILHTVGDVTFDNDLSVSGDVSVAGNFTITGDIVYDTDTFILSTNTPVTAGYAYIGVYRGNTTSQLGTANANAYIRWSATDKIWQIRDVDNTDNLTSFSKVLTANLITTSTATTSNTTFASSWLMKDYVDNANTNLKSYVDVAALTSQANVGAGLISYKATQEANVGAGLIVTKAAYEANVGAARIGDKALWEANVGAGLITTKAAYEANVGVARIGDKALWEANTGAALLFATSATATANTNMKNYVDTRTTTNISEGTNLYHTTARARGAVSASGSLSYNSTTGVFSYSAPTTVSSFTNDSGYITSAGRAYPRRSDGGDLNFYWSGQSGQPTWLWGGNDGNNMYVYNPSNFSVNYATSCSYASYLNNSYAYTNGSDGWFRSTGDAGWYNVTYAGGIYMTDTSWVRVYNSKAFYVGNTIASTGDIIAYYSDERLKERKGNITGALESVMKLNGFRYTNNDLAREKGYTDDKIQIGLSAQEVEAVYPEIVRLAPFDMKTLEDGTIVSESGENYKTLDYAKLVPVLIEAIKELKQEIELLKKK